MSGPFVLEFYKPDPRFYTPQGGSTYMPLTGDWLKSDGITRYGVAFAVSDTDTFDFGTQLPNLIVSKSLTRFGDKIQRYTLRDRAFKCSIYVTGDTLPLAKFGVQQIQSVCAEATQWTASSQMNDGLGSTAGTFFFLKYQPDTSTPAVYFRIISGYVDLAAANSQSLLNANMMKVDLNLRISFAGYGPAVWLQNLVPNGTFANWFTGYTATGTSFDNSGSIGTGSGPGKVNLRLDIGPNAPVLAGPLPNNGMENPYGVDQAWGVTGGISDVWSAMTYNSGNQVSSPDIVYTPEASIMGNLNFPTQKVWLAFEYFDNAAAGGLCSAQLQFWNNQSTGAWYNVGAAIVPTNNVPNARYAWNAPYDMQTLLGGTVDPTYTIKFRVAFSFDRSRPRTTQAVLRKIALWAFPALLPASMIVLPTEYVSQAADMTQSTFITGIQGNAETPVRAKLANPLQITATGPSSSNNVIFQRAYIGARKYQKFPFRFFYKYAIISSFSMTSGSFYYYFNPDIDNVATGTQIAYKIPLSDMRARQYRALVRLSTNSAVGFGIVNRHSGSGDFSITPNGSVQEIASTGAVTVVADAGVATIPPLNSQRFDESAQNANGFSPVRSTNGWVTRSISSIAGTISGSVFGLWLLPTDQYMDIDTRTTESTTFFDTGAWSNYTDITQAGRDPSYSCARELVINTMFRTSPSIHLGNAGEFDSGTLPSAPAYSGTGFTFLPATPSSPEPMQFCAVVRRQGVSGAPAADVVESDPISWAFLYMPAWEF